jgi:iron complex outermembrane receptor protein/vitamin B12 transporter
MRGGDASHLLILVDGLPFYDPSTLNKTVNLNQIDINSIRRIEISKGAQTVLYGGQALVGVIKIETFPKDLADQVQMSVEGGERSYRKLSAQAVRDLSENRALIGRALISEKEGRSPVLESAVTYPTQTLGGDIGLIQFGDVDTYFKVSGLQDRTNIVTSNYSDFRAVDAADFETKATVSSLSAGLRGKKWDLKPTLLAGYQYSDKRYSFLSNPLSGGGPLDDKYKSELINVRLQAIPWDREAAQVTIGGSYNQETLLQIDIADKQKADAESDSYGIFVRSDFVVSSDWELVAGLRQDQVRGTQEVDTFQVGATFRKNLKMEYATGYKAPSLSQLYAYGANPNLKPERSRTLTLDYSLAISEDQRASLTVFESLFDNLIVYQTKPPPATGQNENISRAATRGLEFQYAQQLSSATRGQFQWGYQEPWDVQNARWLLRRPLQTGSLGLDHVLDQDRFHFELVWNGERLDRFSLTTYGNLEAYLISNASWTRTLSDEWSTYLRVSNLGNARFEESRGYFNEGAFWLVGLEWVH